MKTSTLQEFIYNELWLFFDQPEIEIVSTFLRMDSVVCWKANSSQQINQFISGLEVTNNAAEHSA